MFQLAQEDPLHQFLHFKLINLLLLGNIQEVIQPQVNGLEYKALGLVNQSIKESSLGDALLDPLRDLAAAPAYKADNANKAGRLYDSLDVIIELAISDKVVNDLSLYMLEYCRRTDLDDVVDALEEDLSVGLVHLLVDVAVD